MTRRLHQTNNEFKGMERRGVCEEVHITIEEDKKLMPTTKATPFQLLPTTFQNKFPFLEMYQRMVQGGQ
jgi:hypothetical protein